MIVLASWNYFSRPAGGGHGGDLLINVYCVSCFIYIGLLFTLYLTGLTEIPLSRQIERCETMGFSYFFPHFIR